MHQSSQIPRHTGLLCMAAAVLGCFLLLAAPVRAEVAISGLEGDLLANVRLYLDLERESCGAAPWRVTQRYQAAPRQIRSALEALGHYGAQIESSLEFEDDCWRAEFAVDPGSPVMVRELDLQLTEETEQELLFVNAVRTSPLQSGVPLHHGHYEQLKNRLLSIANERGYVDARLTEQRIDVYPDQLAADITLRFDSGPRYTFGHIELDQDVLQDRLVVSYMGFVEGDFFDQQQLTSLYIELLETGYFATVNIRSGAPDHETTSVPVMITLTPSRPRLITYGLGYSTDTGPRLRFGRDNRRYNDRGHQFGLTSQLSAVTTDVVVNYRFPFGDPRTEWVSFDGGVRHERTDTSVADSLQFGARRVVELRRSWTRTQRVSLLFEDFEIGEQTGSSRLLMPAVEWFRLRADDTLRPRNGTRLDLEVRAAADEAGSDTSFFQSIVRGKWVHSLPSRARILVRGSLGLTWKDAFDDLPPSVRFFTGGDTSVRGYRFDSLGAANEQGEIVGGSSLLVGSVEYEHPLRGRWSVAAFVDSGDAFRGSDFRPKTGAGLGLRWQSPLGPVRIDVASPLDDRDTSYRWHITLGPDL